MSALDKQVSGSHYKNLSPQPAEVLRAWGISHLEGEAIYRILRHRQKSGREDLEKVIHTIELILEIDYPQEQPANEPAKDDEGWIEWNGGPEPKEAYGRDVEFRYFDGTRRIENRNHPHYDFHTRLINGAQCVTHYRLIADKPTKKMRDCF